MKKKCILLIAFVALLFLSCNRHTYKDSLYSLQEMRNYAIDLLEGDPIAWEEMTETFLQDSPDGRNDFFVEYEQPDETRKDNYLTWDRFLKEEGADCYPPESIIEQYFQFCEEHGKLRCNRIIVYENRTIGYKLYEAYDSSEEHTCSTWLVKGSLDDAIRFDSFFLISSETLMKAIYLGEGWFFISFR